MSAVDDTGNSRSVDAQLLRQAWDRRFSGQRGLRKALADKHGVHESFIGLLLNGHSPILALWKVRMADYLGVPVNDIWPDFDLAKELAAQLPPHVAELLSSALEADPELVRAAQKLLASSKAD